MKYVFDIDGTICKEEGDVISRKPYIERINKINKLYDEGHEIVYMTARGLKSGRGETYYRPITEEQLNHGDVSIMSYHLKYMMQIFLLMTRVLVIRTFLNECSRFSVW